MVVDSMTKVSCVMCGIGRTFSGGLDQEYYRKRFEKLGVTKEQFIATYVCKYCKNKNKNSKNFCKHTKGLSRELDGSLSCMICGETLVE